jgi:predicted transcriptional regulator
MRHNIYDIRHAYIHYPDINSNGANAMKLPCEIAVKSVVPAIRARLAIELTQKHKLRQIETAKLLSITQTAVSKYAHYVRGNTFRIDEENVKKMITETATSLVQGSLNVTTLAQEICSACRLVREKGLMCQLCKSSNPTLDPEKCTVCNPSPHQSQI